MAAEIEKLFSDINKTLGQDTVVFCTEGNGPQVVRSSTGSLAFDLALGGGLPRARIIELYGNSMAGKTTIAFLHMAEIQKEEALKVLADPDYREQYIAFIDMEHAMNRTLASEYGVNLDKMIYVNPKTAENAVDVMDALIRSGQVRLIVTDSVSAMVPTKIVESSAEQQTIGLLARFMSTTMQKVTGISYEHDCTLMFINQIRDKIGGFSPNGTPTTTSGGKSLPFYSSVRVQVKMGEYIKQGKEVIGRKAA